MGRLGLVLASLVVAVPGAALSVLAVMAFLSYADTMSGTLLGLSAVTLLVSALAAFLPVGIFLFTPKGPAAKASDAGVPAASDEAVAVAAAESGEIGEVEEEFDSGPQTMEGIAVAESSPSLDEFSYSEIETEGEDFDFEDLDVADEGASAESEEDFDFDFEDEK